MYDSLRRAFKVIFNYYFDHEARRRLDTHTHPIVQHHCSQAFAWHETTLVKRMMSANKYVLRQSQIIEFYWPEWEEEIIKFVQVLQFSVLMSACETNFFVNKFDMRPMNWSFTYRLLAKLLSVNRICRCNFIAEIRRNIQRPSTYYYSFIVWGHCFVWFVKVCAFQYIFSKIFFFFLFHSSEKYILLLSSTSIKRNQRNPKEKIARDEK